MVKAFQRVLLAAGIAWIWGSAHTAAGVEATGGVVTVVSGYRIHVFTNSGTFAVSAGGSVEVLVVAGGGGGGRLGGGGGGGGVVYSNTFSVSVSNYAVTVGVGGSGSTSRSAKGGNGSNSVFATITAAGGGGAGSYSDPYRSGSSGGSGGGAACQNAQGGTAGSPGTASPAGQGFNGGGAPTASGDIASGGGGGSGSAGATGGAGGAGNSVGGAGGTGLVFSISGTATNYAGGGGGGGTAAGAGGAGGGGAGSIGNNNATPGAPNTGGGGGGSRDNAANGGNGASGGSGLVIVRYMLDPPPAIETRAATGIGATQATLNGYLSSTGKTATAVLVYWGQSDGTNAASAWATNALVGSSMPTGAVQYATGGTELLAPDRTYYCRFLATNAGGEAWATSSVAFITGEVSIEATDPEATEGGDSAQFTLSRPESTTNRDLVVTYAFGGTAENGVDCSLLSGSTTLPAGATSVDLAVTAPRDVAAEPDETVVLTLSAGPYVLGAMSSATVTIHNAAASLTNYWGGAGENWTNAALWSEGFAPLDGQAAAVTGNVTLSSATAGLRSYTLAAGKTNTFTGAGALLRADDVLVNGTLTHTTNSDTSATGGWTMDGMLRVVCTSFTLATNGVINVSNKGWTSTTNGAGYGPGGSPAGARIGAGHGGLGGWDNLQSGYTYGPTYDVANAPTNPGSGGGSAGAGADRGGYGGGLVRLSVAGSARLDGVLLADGETRTTQNKVAGGSGGGVSIHCRSAYGLTNAALYARGGGGGVESGAGGGGRIALWQAHFGYPGRWSVAPGSSGANPQPPTAGTYVVGALPDPQLNVTNQFGRGLDLHVVAVTGSEAVLGLQLRDAGQATNAMLWRLATSTPWLSPGAANGSLAAGAVATIEVTNNASALAAGTYGGTLTLTATNASMFDGVDPVIRTVGVTLTVVDSLPPLIASVSSATASGTYADGAPIGVTVNFSEAVTLSGGTLDVTLDTGDILSIAPFESATSASATYTVSAGDSSPDLDAVAVALGAGAVLTNAAGAAAFVALPAETIADSKDLVVNPLTAVLSSAAADTNALAAIPVAVAFSREVFGFCQQDVTIANGTNTGFVAVSPSNFVFNVIPLGRGAVTVLLAAGVAEDARGAANLASDPLARFWAYPLTVTVQPEDAGTVAGTNLWAEATLQITANPAPGHSFVQWSGTGVPDGAQRDNPLALTMDRARTLQANFTTNLPAGVRTWVGTNNWFTATNWIPAAIPLVGDSVVINSGLCRVQDPVWAASLFLSNATVSCANWLTALNVAEVTVATGGVLTCNGPFANTASNRVWIVCNALTVEPGGLIDVNYKGYQGNLRATGSGPQPGSQSDGESSGGGHGGKGGTGGGWPGQPYDSTYAPVIAGSAGGSATRFGGAAGGAGGGVVRVEAAQSVTLGGTIRGYGQNGPAGRLGAGAGGALYLTTRSFQGGTTGRLDARGGDGPGASAGGGGGRIAVWRSYHAYSGTTNVAAGINGSPLATAGTAVYGFLPDPAVQPVSGGGSGYDFTCAVSVETNFALTFDLWEAGEDTNRMYWTLSTTNPWIALGAAAGFTEPGATNSLVMTNSTAGLAEGVYTGYVFLAATNRSMSGGVEPVRKTIRVLMTAFAGERPMITSIASTTPAGRYRTGDPIHLAVTFSEAVGLGDGTLDLTLDTGRVISFAPFEPTGSISTNFVVQDGEVSPDLDVASVALGAGASLTNAAGRGALLDLPVTNLADASDLVINGLEVTLDTPAADPTGLMPIPVTVTFNRSVSDFGLGDVAVGNGAASGLAGSGSNYTFGVLAAGRGTVTVDIAAAAAHDSYGTANLAPPSLTRFFAYPLSVSVMPPGAGSVSGTDTWFDATVSLQATASNGYQFVQWSGTVPEGQNGANPLVAAMDRPRVLQANFGPAAPVTGRRWDGNGTWFTATNWTPQGIPASGEAVLLGSGTLVLADPATVGSLTVTNGATLLFTNWTTRLTAGSVLVLTNGLITHAGPYPTGVMSNRVHIVCGNLTIEPGGSVAANARGYMGRTDNSGYGPGGGGFGQHEASGGGYGGVGGTSQGTPGGTYGDATNPVAPGSAGGASTDFTDMPGGAGGGVIRVEAASRIEIGGSLTANGGAAPDRCGGGSGGSVWLTCLRLSGPAGGRLEAKGGELDPGSGAGGGGRIAVWSWEPGSNNTPPLVMSVSVLGGGQGYGGAQGGAGTVYWGQARGPSRGSVFIVR